MFFNNKIKIGCEIHSISEWNKYTDKEILQMDGKKALDWWKAYKTPILAIARNQVKRAAIAKKEGITK